MADSKITALTAITTVNPATYPLVIVDTSDTSMAGSGTTKKVTTNQLLGSGGTATLASATITGDLTVRTNKLAVTSTGVGINKASPAYALDVVGNATISAAAGSNNWFYIAGNGNTVGSTSFDIGQSSINEGYVFNRANGPIIFGVNNTTAMTLNSTGLGVGGSPSSRLDVANSGTPVVFSMTLTGAQRWQQIIDTSVGNWTLRDQTGSKDVLIATAGTGNVGIGITSPSYLLHTSVPTGGDRNMVRFQVSGASSGLTITWNNGTQKMHVNFGDLPTSSAGLPANTLWVDTAAGNTLKLA